MAGAAKRGGGSGCGNNNELLELSSSSTLDVLVTGSPEMEAAPTPGTPLTNKPRVSLFFCKYNNLVQF